jgi:hypothetical protein
MSDDLLERATAALRETTAEPTPELERARERARLLSGARRRAGLRPQTLWQWAAVILAGFFVSTAMAHVIRVQGPRILEALRSQAEEPASKPKPARRAQPAKTPPTPAVAEPEVPQAPAVAVPAPSAPAPSVTAAASDAGATLARPKLRTQSRPLPKPSATTSVQAPHPQTSSDSPELTLFRKAQALHLARDARAIEAWDAYLSAAEHGPLVPEAKYNRALGLVRAGRFAEAKSALSPFAEGAFGGYRQREAQALLARLAQ